MKKWPGRFYKMFKNTVNNVLDGDANSYPPKMNITVGRWMLDLTFHPDVMLMLEELILAECKARGVIINEDE